MLRSVADIPIACGGVDVTRRSAVWLAALTFAAGIIVGGYLFAASQPRSFLALTQCDHCYQPKELAGLLASVGIQRAEAALPLVVKQTDKCLAIRHPLPEARVHFVVFPKKDIKSIGDVSIEDGSYVLDCLAVIRALVTENRLRNYRVVTNGPGLQEITYLHFHVLAR
jgi:histidine triad (HIT) family protein